MTTALLPRGCRFGDLRLTGFVGSGGFSDVYEAFDSKGRRLAVKVLRLGGIDRQHQGERIQRETEILSRIDSRGVSRLVSADLTADPPWIASEFVDGPTLKESVRADGTFSQGELDSLVHRLAEILAELHAQGISHRDLSPSNVILGSDGPVIIDFGSARIDLEADVTGSLLLAGTHGYVAPEALRGDPVGRSADVYSLARIAQFCLTGSDDDELTPGGLLASALVSVPSDRPTAAMLAAGIAPSQSLGQRHRVRAVAKLKRRYSLRSVVLLAALSALVTLAASLYFLGSIRETTVEDVLDGQVFSVPERTEGELLQIKVPDGWEAVRRRPVDTVGGLSSGVLGAWEVARVAGVFQEPNETDSSWAEVQLLVRSAESFVGIEGAHAAGVPPDIAVRFDRHVDRFAVLVVPDGCSLDRASSVVQRDDGSWVWAAGVRDCDGAPGVEFVAGIVWSDTSDLLVEWISRSAWNADGAVVVNSLSLRSGYQLSPIEGDVRFEELVGNQLQVAIGGRAGLSGSMKSGDYGIAAFLIRPGESVEMESVGDSEAQVMFTGYRQLVNGLVPMGRWWQRISGEQRVLSNPFDEDLMVFVEADALFEDAQAEFVLRPSKLEPKKFELSDFLSFPSVEGSDESSVTFLLPSNPRTSSDALTETVVFILGEVEIPFETSLYGISYQSSSFTNVLRADDTFEPWELSWIEPDLPHLLVASAPEMEQITARATGDWIAIVDSGICSNHAAWVVQTETAEVRLHAHLGCMLEDNAGTSAWPFYTGKAPIIRFAAGDRETGTFFVAGSFVPESVEELERFRTFVDRLVGAADELVAAGNLRYEG